MSDGQIIEVVNPCGPRTGEGGLRELWAGWTPAERQQFAEGLAGLGWRPAGTVDYASPVYPSMIAMPGNPCFQGMQAMPGDAAGMPGGGDDGMSWTRGANPNPLAALLDFLASLPGRIADALRRLLEILAGLFGGIGLWLALALLIGGAVLIAADRRRRA
jgi:hypothetical protein